jgi:hypothetical protein
VTVDPTLDPVEDFLFNRQAGHCEYFASTLALMLRAVDVPARVVCGFKGGSVNAISGVFEVEQRHAHAWVEAYLGDSGHSGEGRWITVDPTPASRETSVQSFAPRIRTAHELASVVSSTWSRLVNMDINAQQSAFYTPIVDAVVNWWRPRGTERPFLARLWIAIVAFVSDPTQWFTLEGLAIATVIGGGTAGIVLLLRNRRRIRQAIRRFLGSRRGSREIRIAFYERFERLCAQLGLVRAPAQTQREFARTVGPRIEQIVVSSNGLAEFPPRLVEVFYRARFREEDLSPSTIAELDRGLASLEHAVRNPRRH